MGTTKKKYIELHGEEAWEIEAKKRNSKAKDYRDNHKEENKVYFKNHYELHRDSKKAYAKNYYLENKEKVLEKNREYSQANKDTKSEYKRNYKKTKIGRASFLIGKYRYLDKQFERGECDLTNEWVVDNIFSSSCIYCGDSDWRHLGCDRINNNLPHTKNNCVCSCGLCNMERADRFTVEEFVEYRKTHPRELNTHTPKKNIIEIDGVKIIRKSIGL